MREIRLILGLLIVALTPLSAGGGPDTPPPKVTAQAWAATADGASAELLVCLTPQADVGASAARAAAAPNSRAARGRHVYATLRTTARRAQGPLLAWLATQGVAYRAFYIMNAVHVAGDRALLRALAARPEVARVMTNPWVRADLPATPPLATAPSGVAWGVAKVGAPQVWDRGYRGQGVVVAGQDTGYEWTHPALRAQYRGWDGATADHDYNWHDAIHSGGGVCGPDAPAPCDDYWHGTHTMGTIVGDDGAGNAIGVAPEARWIGCRNMDQGWGSPATYIECFEFFLAPYPVDGGPAQGDPALAPDVINNSWGCPPSEGCDAEHIALLRQVVENVRAAGIMVVASAGNSGPSCGSVKTPPGMYAATYTVGATQSDDTITSFSSRGTESALLKPDLTAPGHKVRSSMPNGTYGLSDGTSMASPHVVGAVALLWSARPDLRGEITATEDLLNAAALPRYSTQCGDPPATVPNAVYGWGRLDAQAAVAAALPPISGTLVGVVGDAEGPLAGAAVRALHALTPTASTHTDAAGAYRLILPPATYTVTASLPGYTGTVRGGVTISEGVTTTLALTLTPGCRPVVGADFTFTMQGELVTAPVVFSGTVLTGTRPITYTWDFGDGTWPATGNPVTHTFPPVTGIVPFSVTMTATNACGVDTASAWVTLRPRRLYLPILMRERGR